MSDASAGFSTPVDPGRLAWNPHIPVGPPPHLLRPTPPGGRPPSDLGGPGQPPLVIGDIVVTENSVQVPQGRYPLRGTTWTAQDLTQESEVTPTYAIVLGILLLPLCLLGLLFLLIREKRYFGFVVVTVAGEGFSHTTHVAVGPTTAQRVYDQVARARELAA